MEITGLTESEARERLEADGPNALPAAPPRSLVRRFLAQFHSPVIYVLLAALAADLGLWLFHGADELPLESLVIAGILLANAMLGLIQEYRADRSLEALKDLAPAQARVKRDGSWTEVPMREVVVGDAVRVEAGDRVPADAEVAWQTDVSVDESMLTGESLPVPKDVGDTLSSGTMVLHGAVVARVVRTGPNSALGALTQLVASVEAERTPLERRLDAFGRRVSVWVLVLAVGLLLGGLVFIGLDSAADVFRMSVAIAVAVVPEGLPAILTITLALGVKRMAEQHALVRRLSAVESLGSVTVIATDKTGTLTENRLTVTATESDDEDRLALGVVLANDAPTEDTGDPVDVSLLRWARSRGLDVAEIRQCHPRLVAVPFDERRRRHEVTVDEGGRATTFVKGAPEVVLADCALDDAARGAVHAAVERHAGRGGRVLGVSERRGESGPVRWLGAVVLRDPPRAEARRAVEAAQGAGIRVIMLTGDHPHTAAAIATEVGMGAGEVVAGEQLTALDDAGRRAALAKVSVVARATPRAKLELVETLQAQGEIVAMTGDGVNDAPALKRADVGIAMGQRGHDVAREASDLVLLDDNFETIVRAVDDGRSIYQNLQSILRYIFAINLAELLVVLGGTLGARWLGLLAPDGTVFLPLTASQILWINLVSETPVAVVLARDRNVGMLSQPPRAPDSPLFDRDAVRFVLVAGACLAAMVAVVLSVQLWRTDSALVARTSGFLTLVVGQLAFAYLARQQATANGTLALVVALAIVGQVALVSLWSGGEAVGLAQLSALDVGCALAGALAAFGSAWAVLRLVGTPAVSGRSPA